MGSPFLERGASHWRTFGHGIYAFDDDPRGLPAFQDASTCEGWLRVLDRFGREEKLLSCSAAAGALRRSCGSGDMSALWLGEYGCVALLIKSLGSAPQERYCIYVLGLDNWEFEVVHRRWTSLSENFVELLVGSLPVTMCADFLAGFRSALAKAQAERTGDKRSAASNEQGHQRTPSFVWALMRDVLRDTKAKAAAREREGGEGTQKASPTQPPGALTDAGLHTGGQARNTSWAIVRAAMEAVMLHLGGEEGLPADLWPRFDVWFLEQHLATLDSSTLQAQDINAAMKVLQTAVKRLASLADLGHGVSTLQPRCEAAKSRLVELARDSAETTATAYTLSNYTIDRPQLRDVVIDGLPVDVSAQASSTSLEDARRLALANLEDVRLPPKDFRSSSASALLSWLQKMKPESSEAMQLVLTTVEQWAFAAMDRLPENRVDAAAVAAVLKVYLETLGESLQADLHSRKKLVWWVGFCLVHDACKWTHRAKSLSFGVPLRWQDLRHLCLEEREAWETVERVRNYLEANSIAGSQLFSLSKPLETMAFAEAFARQDEDMCRLLREEKEDAEQRKRDYCVQVDCKKNLAAKLRREIGGLDDEVSYLKSKLETLRCRLRREGTYSTSSNCEQEQRIQDDIDDNESSLRAKRRELTSAEAAPSAVKQPMPEDDALARRVIFC